MGLLISLPKAAAYKCTGVDTGVMALADPSHQRRRLRPLWPPAPSPPSLPQLHPVLQQTSAGSCWPLTRARTRSAAAAARNPPRAPCTLSIRASAGAQRKHGHTTTRCYVHAWNECLQRTPHGAIPWLPLFAGHPIAHLNATLSLNAATAAAAPSSPPPHAATMSCSTARTDGRSAKRVGSDSKSASAARSWEAGGWLMGSRGYRRVGGRPSAGVEVTQYVGRAGCG